MRNPTSGQHTLAFFGLRQRAALRMEEAVTVVDDTVVAPVSDAAWNAEGGIGGPAQVTFGVNECAENCTGADVKVLVAAFVNNR